MSLASKLQAAHVKVNQRLDFQAGPLLFCKDTQTAGDIGEEQTKTTNSVSIDGARVSQVSIRSTAPYGPFELDDLVLLIPKTLIAKTDIEGAYVLYDSLRYSILQYGPAPVSGTPAIMGGEVINWRVVVRKMKG